jgi:hypothetical protein
VEFQLFFTDPAAFLSKAFLYRFSQVLYQPQQIFFSVFPGTFAVISGAFAGTPRLFYRHFPTEGAGKRKALTG